MNAYYKTMSSDEIYHALKEDILTLKLKPGQMISENEVSRSYNVSRTPVKTAFLRLKGEKYIDIMPQKGSFVTLLDIQYIRDIIYMRSVLETDVLTTVMEQGACSGLIAELRANLQAQLEFIERGDLNPRDFYAIDSQFHYTMFEYVGRTKMWDVIQDCQVYYTRFRILDTLTTARYQQLYQEHVGICDALEGGNLNIIKKSVHDHLHGNLKVLAKRIEGEYNEYFIPYGASGES